jgi:hypothetical protein
VERKVAEAAKIALSSTKMLSKQEGNQHSVSLRRGEVNTDIEFATEFQ